MTTTDGLALTDALATCGPESRGAAAHILANPQEHRTLCGDLTPAAGRLAEALAADVTGRDGRNLRWQAAHGVGASRAVGRQFIALVDGYRQTLAALDDATLLDLCRLLSAGAGDDAAAALTAWQTAAERAVLAGVAALTAPAADVKAAS